MSDVPDCVASFAFRYAASTAPAFGSFGANAVV